jgi:hypothetical protein
MLGGVCGVRHWGARVRSRNVGRVTSVSPGGRGEVRARNRWRSKVLCCFRHPHPSCPYTAILILRRPELPTLGLVFFLKKKDLPHLENKLSTLIVCFVM